MVSFSLELVRWLWLGLSNPQQTGGVWRGRLIVTNPGKHEVGWGTGGDLVLPLARSRAGVDAGLCKSLLVAFSPAGLECAEKELGHFPATCLVLGTVTPVCWSGLDLLLSEAAVSGFGSAYERWAQSGGGDTPFPTLG